METQTTAQGPSRAVDVYAVRCTEYGQADRAISELITRMGGFRQFVEPGEHIALKVNLLRKADPGEAVTTHPDVVKPLAELIGDGDAHAVIVDSPGGGYRFNRGTLRAIYHATGMRDAAASSGAELNYDTGYKIVANPEGHLIKRFEVLSRILSANGVINVCK